MSLRFAVTLGFVVLGLAGGPTGQLLLSPAHASLGPANTSCYFQPNLRQYLQTPATGPDAAYDWVMCPYIGARPAGQSVVNEFTLESSGDSTRYDRLELRGWYIPSRYQRVGFGWLQFRQSVQLTITRTDGGAARTVYQRTFLATGADPTDPSQVISQDPYVWLVSPASASEPLVIDEGNLGSAHYTFATTVVSETRVGFTWGRPQNPVPGHFTANVRKNALPAPGPFDLTVQPSCQDRTPIHTLTWTASSDATSYTVYRDSQPLTTTTELGATDTTSSAAPGEKVDYLVQALNAAGVTNSNTISSLTPQCVSAPVQVTVTPATIVLARGASQTFTASAPQEVTWSLNPADSRLGTLTKTGALQSELKVGDKAELTTYDKIVQAAVTVDGTRYVGHATVKVVDRVTQAQITGDVFAGGNVANIKVDPTSVVSANGTIENVSTTNTIANYTRDTVEQTEALINKIVAEKAREIAVSGDGAERQASISGTFNLNPKPFGNPNDLNAANPEGGVWHVAGDLVITTPTTFKGRGTIVVDGNVTMQASGTGQQVDYADDNALVGIIARGDQSRGKNGDITISGFLSVVGAYYAPKGKITIGENVTVSKGLFVGNAIELGQSNVSITYDGRITKNPPLGFSQNFTPSISEVTP